MKKNLNSILAIFNKTSDDLVTFINQQDKEVAKCEAKIKAEKSKCESLNKDTRTARDVLDNINTILLGDVQ